MLVLEATDTPEKGEHKLTKDEILEEVLSGRGCAGLDVRVLAVTKAEA